MSNLQWVILIITTFTATIMIRIPSLKRRMAAERKRNFYDDK